MHNAGWDEGFQSLPQMCQFLNKCGKPRKPHRPITDWTEVSWVDVSLSNLLLPKCFFCSQYVEFPSFSLSSLLKPAHSFQIPSDVSKLNKDDQLVCDGHTHTKLTYYTWKRRQVSVENKIEC